MYPDLLHIANSDFMNVLANLTLEPSQLHRKITKVEAMIDTSLYVHQI